MLTPILPTTTSGARPRLTLLSGPRPLAFQEELGERESGQRASSITDSR